MLHSWSGIEIFANMHYLRSQLYLKCIIQCIQTDHKAHWTDATKYKPKCIQTNKYSPAWCSQTFHMIREYFCPIPLGTLSCWPLLLLIHNRSITKQLYNVRSCAYCQYEQTTSSYFDDASSPALPGYARELNLWIHCTSVL